MVRIFNFIPEKILIWCFLGHLCRGSILTYKLILTAAHCVDVSVEQGKNITIVTADGSQRVNVVETHIHPGWTK